MVVAVTEVRTLYSNTLLAYVPIRMTDPTDRPAGAEVKVIEVAPTAMGEDRDPIGFGSPR